MKLAFSAFEVKLKYEDNPGDRLFIRVEVKADDSRFFWNGSIQFYKGYE